MSETLSLRQIRTSLQTELDAAYLYKTLSDLEPQEQLAQVYRQLAEVELRHVRPWEERLRAQGAQEALRPSRRARVLAWVAKRFGPAWVLPALTDMEDSLSVAVVKEKGKTGMAPSGREHAHGRILESLRKSGGSEGSSLAQLEGRHRTFGGNSLRAAVLGANDGLVSNLSLIMGVAGASSSNEAILIAGFAGLLAGAISMAMGEWLSVQSSRELYQRQIEIEAAELEANPEEEALELALIYQAKGLPEEQALALARKLIENPDTAMDTLAREELGVDPDELGGSAWEAAFASFALFAFGAIFPLAPFLFLSGPSAVWASVAVSAAGLFLIGAGITLLTGKSIWFSGGRQVLFGLAAAALTYGIGRALGVTLLA
jgi:VIT1/CCC1 family predicted Fe2+/Mn2+ transporter